MPFSPKNWLDRPSELNPLVDETVKEWFDRIALYASENPGTLTPVDAAALEDLEARLSGYTDDSAATIMAYLTGYAPLASPVFTGNPQAPTPSPGDNDNAIATTAFVADAVSGAGGSAHVIEDEGTPLTQRSNLNFVGSGVAVTDDSGNDATVVTISGGGGGVTALSWTALSYAAGVGDNNDGVMYTASWAKDDYGIVHLRGKIAGNVAQGGTMFTLPVGARPASYVLPFAWMQDINGFEYAVRLQIDTGGVVAAANALEGHGTAAAWGTNIHVCLDGITFPTLT